MRSVDPDGGRTAERQGGNPIRFAEGGMTFGERDRGRWRPQPYHNGVWGKMVRIVADRAAAELAAPMRTVGIVPVVVVFGDR